MLVVDDVPEICDLFRRTVRRMRGLEVELTTEINSARAKALVAEKRFDLVVSDFRMREANGLEVLRASRETHPEGRRLLITGYNEVPAALADIRAAHVDGYLQKPLEDHDLVLVLRTALLNEQTPLAAMREHARMLEDAAEREARQLAPGG